MLQVRKIKQMVLENWNDTSGPSASVVLKVVNILHDVASETAEEINGTKCIALIHCRYSPVYIIMIGYNYKNAPLHFAAVIVLTSSKPCTFL